MQQARTYGRLPYRAFLVHGGPGAIGEMAPVAKRLSTLGLNVVEPLQSKRTIAELILELKETIERYSDRPVPLVGYSWGRGYVGWLPPIIPRS